MEIGKVREEGSRKRNNTAQGGANKGKGSEVEEWGDVA